MSRAVAFYFPVAKPPAGSHYRADIPSLNQKVSGDTDCETGTGLPGVDGTLLGASVLKDSHRMQLHPDSRTGNQQLCSLPPASLPINAVLIFNCT